jgi:hypothetical protein
MTCPICKGEGYIVGDAEGNEGRCGHCKGEGELVLPLDDYEAAMLQEAMEGVCFSLGQTGIRRIGDHSPSIGLSCKATQKGTNFQSTGSGLSKTVERASDIIPQEVAA